MVLNKTAHLCHQKSWWAIIDCFLYPLVSFNNHSINGLVSAGSLNHCRRLVQQSGRTIHSFLSNHKLEMFPHRRCLSENHLFRRQSCSYWRCCFVQCSLSVVTYRVIWPIKSCNLIVGYWKSWKRSIHFENKRQKDLHKNCLYCCTNNRESEILF